MSEGNNYAPNEPIGAMVDCEVCDRSHAPSHPHIANIEGDVPIDDAPAPEPSKEISSGSRPVGRAPLPAWLKDKPGSQAIRPSTGTADQVDPTKLCQVCGKPWAPRHDCNPAEATATKERMTPYHMRQYAKCDVCGKRQQRNHKCKGRPDAEAVNSAGGCEHCKAAGELCVRHGGRWADYDTPRGAAEPVARELPKPVSVAMSAPEAPRNWTGSRSRYAAGGNSQLPQGSPEDAGEHVHPV